MIDYYRAAVRPPKGTKTELQPISAPTLVIWGRKDRYLGPDLRRAPPRGRPQPRPRRAPARRVALGPTRRGQARHTTANRLLRPRPRKLTPPTVDGVWRTGLAAMGPDAASSEALGARVGGGAGGAASIILDSITRQLRLRRRRRPRRPFEQRASNRPPRSVRAFTSSRRNRVRPLRTPCAGATRPCAAETTRANSRV